MQNKMKQCSILLFFLSFFPLLSFSQTQKATQTSTTETSYFYRPSRGITFSPSFGAYYQGFEQNFTSNSDQWSNIWAYGFRFGYAFNPAIELEANFMYTNTRRGVNRQTVYFYSGHALYNFNMFHQKIAPYVLAGVGNLSMVNQFAFNYYDFSAYYGLGVRYFLNPKLAVRGEFHAINNFDKSHTGFWSGILLTVYTQQSKKYSQIKKVDKSTIDSDGDGITDDKDNCPLQPETVNQFEDEDGCPDTLPKHLLDSDSDGIMDDKDQCPLQPETINDYQDDDGCPDEVPNDLKAFVGRIENIFFEFDSATISKTSYGHLNQSIETLKRYPNLFVLIEGHTDSIGTHEYNDKLSLARAKSVKTYLVTHGLDEKRLAVKGYGSTKPMANNDTDEGRAQNRRIEFKLLTKPNQAK
ncbi:MAG TPA: OmpA family protein [Oligoflexia bacterium]|nr:OmpA family protein [Oligoflexia bacterium]